MTWIWKDLRHGARLLARKPGSSAAAVLAFALGIGLTTAQFSVVRGGLQGLPFEAAERLIHLERNNLSQGIDSMEVTLHDFRDWRQAQTSFEGLAGFYTGTANLSDPQSPPERYDAAFISANAFEMLRVQPFAGRTFRPEEEGAGSPAVAILGHDLWQTRYDGDRSVVGRTIRINSEPHTVIGVMGPGFEFPINQDLWLPLRLDPDEVDRGEGMTLEVFGRLADGVTPDQAAVEFATLAERLAQEYPDTDEGVGSVLKPYTEEYLGSEVPTLLYTMLGAVFLVFLIACANVANLLLGRAIARSQEMAVRSALGAARWRVISGLLAEGLVLAAVGTVIGMGLAQFAVHLFNLAILDTDPPFWIDIRLDLPVLVFAAGLALLATLLSGWIPALKATGEKTSEILQDESRGASSLRMGRFSKGLVVAEITLSCALLVAAGLMVRSITSLATTDFGFDPDPIFTARIGLFEDDYPEETDRQTFFGELERRVQALPGVQVAGLGSGLPASGTGGSPIALEGETYERSQDHPWVHRVIVTPGWLEAFETRPLAGRLLEESDREGTLPVILVNQDFVDNFFDGDNPLGRRIRFATETPDEPWRTIVGVVPSHYLGALDDADDSRDQAGLYVPLSQTDARFLSIVARVGSGDPMTLREPIQQAVLALDPHLPIYFVRTMPQVIQQAGWFYQVFGVTFMVFGAAALLMAAIGLYGVMSFTVSRRTREVGIRMALGARAEQVLQLILHQGMKQLALGLVLGLGLAYGLARLLTTILYDVQPGDPLTFVLTVAVLLVAGMAACLRPALQAARTDPMAAMRYQ